MTVRELREFLEHYPDDMVVVDGRGAELEGGNGDDGLVLLFELESDED